uniref:DNA polymerase beta n=1 Tax=viral metagenome TaxID=1070528 RepID=A0A6C0AXS7_9ZZZZ
MNNDKNKTLKKSKKLKKLKLVRNYETVDKMRYNEDFIKILGELTDIMTRQSEPFRAKAYQKAQETIIAFKGDITDPEKQLKGKTGIGNTILSKLEEYINTGTLGILEREKNNPVNLFTKIYGVGPKKADELVKAGITSISDLRKNNNVLNDIQKVGLKYYDDINERIPRSEIDDFFITLSLIFEELAPMGAKFDIVGSYRRGLANSGDIDVIITNEKNNNSVFNQLLDRLIENGIIIEVLSRGKVKSLVIAKIYPDKKDTLARRVDFLYAPPEEYAFAVLYFTGSKIFNTLMRQRALDLGYTLNEHGLSYMKGGVKGSKVDKEFPDEKSIFDFLGMKYKKPEERIDGQSIEFKEDIIPPPEKKEDGGLEGPTLHNKTLKKLKIVSVTDNINKFKKEGISALKMMTESELTTIIHTANNAYYCDEEPILTDNLYDILIEYMLEKYPKNTVAKEGHTNCDVIVEKNKVKLPYELWSMDKLKPTTDAVNKWIKKYSGPYVISCKLDGISALYISGKKSNEAKLYTRGNGIYGQDITHLIPSIIWKNKSINDFEISFAIRGEIIIKKSVFEKKYADKFANPRNFVAGIVNKKSINHDILSDLDFVPYEVIKPEIKPSEQMGFLLSEWVSPPVNFVIERKISNENLSELLLEWREKYDYEIDGVIVVNDEIYPRPEKNPEYAFAFKMVISDQIAEAKVVDVIWTPSKDGYLKPRVRIEPIVLGGVKIEYATGFNAKFIKDNNIGIGALVSIVRSGDVIPHIVSVVEPAEMPKMPDGLFEWNDTGVDAILIDKDDNSVVREKNITSFFKGLQITGLGSGIIKNIINAGFDTVPKIIAMNKKDFLKVEGFKEKLASKIFNGIKEKVDGASLVELMAASNIFGRGFGERRFQTILKIYPDILISNISDKEKINMLIKIDGLANKTAQNFVEKIPNFIEFMNDAGLEGTLYNVSSNISTKETEFNEENPLWEKKIVMTGFRDKELMEKIKSVGGEIAASVSKNTFLVLVKDKDVDTSKVDEAKKLGLPIMTPNEFTNKYFAV